MHTVKFKQPKAKQKLSLLGKLKGFLKKPLDSFKTHEVVFFDNPKDLPHRRYNTFNMYFCIDCEVGSSIADYNKRTARGISYLNADNLKAASQEFTNRMNTLHHALEKYSPKGLALATMVYSINGVVYENYGDDDIEGISKELDKIGFTQLMLEENLDHVKKK